MTDHAAVPCPAPPEERVCCVCGDPVDEDGCFDNADRPLCSADLGECPECRDGMEDDYAAELSMDRDR